VFSCHCLALAHAQVPHCFVDYYISYISGYTPIMQLYCKRSMCTTFSFFTNPRSCLMKASFGGEAVSRWRMRIKTEARAVFDFGIRCSPSVAITRPDVSRAPVACLALYRIHPSHLLPYPHPSLHSPICPASSHLTLVLITTSLLFLPVILLNHVFASSSWSVLPHPRNHPSFFCQCRS
jgi:hypothetical protein